MFSLILLAFGCWNGDPEGPDLGSEARAPELRVATSGDYPPFSDWPEDAPEPVGFSPALVRAFARAEGLEIEWQRFRWAELLSDLRAQRFDLAISGVTLRPERSIAGRFSVPITVSSALVLVPRSSRARLARDLDHPDVRIAVNAGGHLEKVARQRFEHAVIEAVDRNEDVLARLSEGLADGVVTDTLEAPHWQARLPGSRRIGPLTRDRKAALFDPSQSQLARRFDVWLMEAEESGALARLRALHGLPDVPTADPTRALLASLDERLSLMTSVARAKAVLGLEIENRKREQRVLTAAWRSVAEAAERAGDTPPRQETVRRLFRAQIDAAKWIQAEELKRLGDTPTPASPGRRREARAALDEALRPALLRIGERIAMLVALPPVSPAPPLDASDTAHALARHALPDVHLQALHQALISLRAPRPAAAGASTHPPPRATPDITPSA